MTSARRQSPALAEESLELLRALLARCPQKTKIALGVSKGLTNRQISEQIGRSEHTVHTLLSQLYQQVGIQSRVSLGVLMSQLETRHLEN